MRIGFVIPYFYPAMGYGGKPRLAYEMARFLVRRGHQVTVFTTDTGGEDRIRNEVIEKIHDNGVDGIRVCYYKNLSNSLAYRQRLFFPTGFFKNITTDLAGNDVVHIHDFRSLVCVATQRAARRLGIPYVLSPHGGLPRLGKVSAKRVFDMLWGKAILRAASALCAISPLEEHDARELGIESRRIHAFPPGIDAEVYKNLPPRAKVQNRKTVLFLGRLHWIKGADLLIEAVSLLGDSTDLRVVIAGPDDGAAGQLKSLVISKGLEQKVTFTGFLDGPAKLNALAGSDAVVVPSRREGFPLAVLEALACQTPVILTSASDLGDWMKEQPGLIQFRTEDVQDLAEKIKRILCYPPSREAMAGGSLVVMNRFSLDALAERAESLYRSLV